MPGEGFLSYVDSNLNVTPLVDAVTGPGKQAERLALKPAIVLNAANEIISRNADSVLVSVRATLLSADYARLDRGVA